MTTTEQDKELQEAIKSQSEKGGIVMTTQPSLDELKDISLENKLIIKDLLRSQQKELLERVRKEIRINRNTFDLGSMYSGQEYVLLEDIDKALDAMEKKV